MKEQGIKLPPRNVLTGTTVSWKDDDMGLIDYPGNLTLTWKDLTVYRKKKTQTSMWRSATYEEIRILHGVNGIASSGNLVAIMGSSGAGKTTLLAAISRRDKSAMTGYIMLNGRLAGANFISRISGFVPQRDLAIEDLTVDEHMQFMARMMMDKRSTKANRSTRIRLLLSELGVNNCSNTKLKSLSGGERKRVSLAVQLLNDPPILFCDEPTSGLDSFAAAAVVSRLRKLAIGGKLVVCSVHQPASGVFDLFHQVVLLASGRIAFQGTIESANQFFASLNYKCPLGFNAAEYYTSLLGIAQDKELECRDRIRRICDAFQRSDMAADIASRVGDVTDEIEYFNGTLDQKDQYFEKYLTLVKVNCFVQFYWLLWRNVWALKRYYNIWVAEFVLLMIIGLLISIPYAGHFEVLEQRDIQNVQGLLYMAIAETIFLFIYSVVITFPSEVHILLRETANGLYSPLPYYLSKMIFWMPRAFINPSLYTGLVFLVAGLRGGFWGWLGFNFICILCANYANSYGSLLSATFDKMETATLFSVPFTITCKALAGIFVKVSTVSPYISWIKYLSGFYYGLENASILEWSYVDSINCSGHQNDCIATGAEALEYSGFFAENYNRNIICIASLYFINNFIAYLMVVKRSRGTPVY